MRTILLADDSVTIQKVIELTFMDEDYSVVSVSNGDAAVSKLGEMRPDLVIADVHMPGASGYQVCRASKQLFPEIPVLLLVGTFEPFDERESAAAGADANLKKPFDSQELLGTVRHLLGTPAAPELALAPEPALAAEAAPALETPPWPDFDSPLLEEPEVSAPAFADAGGGMPFSDVEPLAPPFEDLSPAPPVAELSWSEERVELEVEPAAWEPSAFEAPIEAATIEAPLAAEPFAGLGAGYEPLRFNDPEPLFEPAPAEEPMPAFEPEATLAEEPVFTPEPPLEVEPALLAEPVWAPEPIAEPAFVPELELPSEPELLAEPEPVFEPAPRAFFEAAAPVPPVAVIEPQAAEPVVPAPPAAETSTALGLSDADVDRIARRVVELIGERVVRDVAWEVVPDLAELAIKDRLKELEAQLEA